MPVFPIWAYQNKPTESLNTIIFNISGTRFEIFDETLMNLSHTKLADNYLYHSGDSALFFDRDPSCFNAILNFYRTGRLHCPPNSCLSFFQEELLFWGINEDLMEPCCYSDYRASKNMRLMLDDYMRSIKKPRKDNTINFYKDIQHRCNLINISENSSIFSRVRLSGIFCFHNRNIQSFSFSYASLTGYFLKYKI